jgi:hypothetical protein
METRTAYQVLWFGVELISQPLAIQKYKAPCISDMLENG